MENEDQMLSLDNPELKMRLTRLIASQFNLAQKVETIVEILLGDIHERPAQNFDEVLQKLGISRERFESMTVEEKIETACRYAPSRTGNVIAVLDWIFHERYAWPEGSVAQMQFAHILLALEHALEHDDPSKPSVWQITK